MGSIRNVIGHLRHPGTFGSRVLQTASTQFLLAVLAVVAGAIAVRLLGPEGRGELAAIQLWAFFFGTIAVLGLPDALLYFSARDQDRTSTYLGSSIALGLVITAFVSVVAFLVLPSLLSAHPQHVVDAARLFLWWIPTYVLWSLALVVLPSRNDYTAWNVLRLLQYVGWLAILITFWVLNHPDPGGIADAYLWFFVGMTILLLAVILPLMSAPVGKPNISDWKPLLRYGLPSALTHTSQIASLRVDQLILAVFLPARTLGFYAAAVTWGLAGRPLLLAVSNVLFPGVAMKQREGMEQEEFLRGIRLGSSLALVLGLLLAVATPLLLPAIFGEEFRKSVFAATVLAIGGTTYGFNSVIEGGFRGLGLPDRAMLPEVAGMVVTVVAVGGSVRTFGIQGAAVGSLLGYLTTTWMLLRRASEVTGLGILALSKPSWRLLFTGMTNLFRFGPPAVFDRTLQDEGPGELG